MKRFCFFLFLLFLLDWEFVQGQSVNDTVHIREVKVLAKRKLEEAGLKITRPDSLQRASSLTTDLSELISNYSPVFIKSYGRGSEATASFRGTAASHTQVLWNGMNLNSPMRGMADLALLPVFFTDDVFLLHGGSSLTKGSGGLGGSIHLENKADWNSGFDLTGMVETGSFHTRKSFFKLMAGGNRLKSNTRLFYETSENDFPFYNSGIIPQKYDTLKNADYWKAGILQEFYLRRLSNEFFALRFWGQQSSRNLPQLMSYEGSSREEYRKDEQLRGQLEWKKYTDVLDVHFFSGIHSNRLHYFRGTPEFNFVNEDSESREVSLLNHLRIQKKISEKMSAVLSFDANYHNVNAKGKTTDRGYREERFETSLLAHVQVKPSDRFAAFFLVRSETYDKSIVPLIPAAGIEWQLFRNLPVILKSNVARNYHKPTLNDLYWIPGGNSGLLPEEGFSGDVSLSARFQGKNVKFRNEISAFLSKIENWIIWQPASSGAYYWEANNVKDVRSGGIEYAFSSKYDWEECRFRSGGNYSFTNTSNLNAVSPVDQSRGKQLIYIPRHKGHLYLSASWKDFTIKYDLNYVGKRFTRSSNRESDYERILNPYWLSKMALDKQIAWNKFTINLKFTVENLLNESYQSILWRPMPGRSYSLSMALNFAR